MELTFLGNKYAKTELLHASAAAKRKQRSAPSLKPERINQDKFNSTHKTNEYFNGFTSKNTKSHNSHHPLCPLRAGVKS